MDTEHNVHVTWKKGRGFHTTINSKFDVTKDWEKIKQAGGWANQAMDLINKTNSAKPIMKATLWSMKRVTILMWIIVLVVGGGFYFYPSEYTIMAIFMVRELVGTLMLIAIVCTIITFLTAGAEIKKKVAVKKS